MKRESEKKTHIVTVRLTPRQHALLKQLAARRKRSVSEVIRLILVKQMTKDE